MNPDSTKEPARRLCRFPGCTKVVKSQGSCQRHGAMAKKCKVEGCDKQAQGTHDGMCKRHWKTANLPAEERPKVEPANVPTVPDGESVYDTILPMSIGYKPHMKGFIEGKGSNSIGDAYRAWDGFSDPPEDANVMPLVRFLRDGRVGKEIGWHRHEERRARGHPPVSKLKVQLEPWERQLALVEILLLSGGTPYANFKDLAYAWGRERNFHLVLTGTVCERRGEIQRKKRSDTGKLLTEEQKQNLRNKRPRHESETESTVSTGGGNGADGTLKSGAQRAIII
ncbi:hypothetical protein FisN_14Lh160 [Fistulifera solaris]|uniref:Uncharacterized protein n=1 Tax=Fistulifera solaris TaxID=1519565 RepID=A0A1Z5J9T3_FISSO|nr:hypothetical protein FisN_14Lh160 [Fistulifera solaris]|eukprot:GAX10652.1 hypothetical protein FisN_14Lh160 [Fistulifera solaris]